MHYQRGDVVGLRTKSGSRAMRIRQLAMSWDTDGKPEGSVVFGARFKSPEEVLSDRLAQSSPEQPGPRPVQQPAVAELLRQPG
ncbi:hypothetical protein [Amycolatopsis sp. NPDC006125]|uniref:hypothetical protein n=1 Tax=Amycolatopsis sp. NPDC006125 TaxID=3156730 RepID=UPI00339E424E